MEFNKVDIKTLNAAKYNPRKDLQPSDPEYVKLKNSIEHFGYVDPVIVNKRNNTVVGGHQRLKVLLDLGYKYIDVVYVDLDDKDEKALNIALNKISGDWDAEKLEDILREISLDSDYDIELTGFTLDEVETLFNGAEEVDDTPYGIARDEIDGDDYDPEKEQEKEDNPRNIKLGDVFRVGRHTLICGDSTDKRFVDALIKDKKVDLVMMDPPYDMDFDDGGIENILSEKYENTERERSRKISQEYKHLSGLETLHKSLDKYGV